MSNSTTHLALPEKHDLTLGYMRLTDSAPLIYAKEYGLFSKYQLEVKLSREVSWANLRDRLVVGDLDAAQMLSPLPMMTAYGAGGLRATLLTGLVLNLNGNAITLANHLAAQLLPASVDTLMPDAQTMSLALASWLTAPGEKRRITFATVHLFSMHTLQLRMWLRAGGIDADNDVKIIVLPPEQMCDSLARGIIDGYCVGEPWNSMAVQQGVGSIITTGYQVWNNAPEKVLAVTSGWHQNHTSTHLRLRLALMEANQKLASAEQRRKLVPVLARPDYLDLPEQVLLPALDNALRFTKQGEVQAAENFLVFGDYQAGFPWRSLSDLIIEQCNLALGNVIPKEQMANLSQQCFQAALYREAARALGMVAPSKDRKREGIHPGLWEFEDSIVLGPDKLLSRE